MAPSWLRAAVGEILGVPQPQRCTIRRPARSVPRGKMTADIDAYAAAVLLAEGRVLIGRSGAQSGGASGDRDQPRGTAVRAGGGAGQPRERHKLAGVLAGVKTARAARCRV